MNILCSVNLVSNLKGADLFFDTNTVIAAINFPDFQRLLQELKDNDCAFITIPSVVFEFTRGTQSLSDFNKRAEFLNKRMSTYPIEKHIPDLEELIIVLQRIKGDISYTDFLLQACLYKFPKSYLITADNKDICLDIFDREHIVTLDSGKEIRSYGIYKFSLEKFDKAAENLLRSSNLPD